MGGPVGGDEGVLDGVGGLLAVPQDPQGDCPQPVAMPPHYLAEGVGIACDMASEKFPIARTVRRVFAGHAVVAPAVV
ncbi:hypothetical protein GCM10010405_59820 [Streptomyces macrosporus]|uniref:Uncharacterized protein n=1 Tax=Streptomyces macrosporus TaxID=44032 RepID=A0ABP5XWC9_9ACTN